MIRLRQQFLDFFKEKGHLVLPSASLIPDETDPSVLFTTAGMQQFKRYYSEPSVAPAPSVTTCQKCVRTGDIDEVGDKTHLTFFEMLGNFSFGYPDKAGSYFKEEAIKLAWEFLTIELEIEKNRIHATYFKGERGVPEDIESKKILESIDGLGKVVEQGFEDNFWSLGTENSPGGPTVEFYIDNVEIWNLVFNEYIFENGEYKPAKYRGVDTGMGLERLLCAINDGLDSVYHTELFAAAHAKLHELFDHPDVPAERVILDHLRAAMMLISDGVIPSNKDRGYVLRRLIRRAIVKGQQLGISGNFTTKIVKEFFPVYEGVYFNDSVIPDSVGNPGNKELDPRIKSEDDKESMILAELDKEETKFRRTLQSGLKILNSLKKVTAEDLFDLYQSSGLPLEISLEELKNKNVDVDANTIEEFEQLKRQHQELSRTASAGMFKGGLAAAGEITTKYHTATHLLLAALRQVLGDQVFQKGSNITAERMRFDFSYPDKMTPEEIKQVEDMVNEKIKADLPVNMEEMSLEDAKNCGAMGVFENKYGEKVKVYTIGDDKAPASREICGGPHVAHTGELGHFKIQKEESSSAGIRRIKAVLE